MITLGLDADWPAGDPVAARKDERRICARIVEQYIERERDDERFPLSGCCEARLREVLELLRDDT